MRKILCIFLFLVPFSAHAGIFKEVGDTPIDNVKILGVRIVDQKVETVRQLLWDLGGFLQAKSTLKQKNVDKFFTWSQIKDSYYIEFRYNPAGNVTLVKRLFRYASPLYHNKLHPIDTREVAREIVAQIGLPTQIVRKSWGAGPSYNSYLWDSEKVKVTVDREGSDYYGNIFVEYKNKIDPFAREQNQRLANR